MRYTVCTALLLSFTCSAHGKEPSYYEPHFSSRTMTIATQSWGLGPGSVMLLGDSNTEMMRTIQIGECQVLNAGFGGAMISDLVERGPMLAEMAKPSIVHVMLGTNDALRKNFTGRDALAVIVREIQSGGAHVVLWALPPIAEGAGEARAFKRINNMIAEVAVETGVRFEDKWAKSITGDDGFAAAGWLVGDGVHLTPNGQNARAVRIADINSEIINLAGVSCKK